MAVMTSMEEEEKKKTTEKASMALLAWRGLEHRGP